MRLTMTAKLSMNSRTSLLGLLDDAARRGHEFAFVQRRGLRYERWTYAQLAATAYQFARELETRGIGKGDRVLLWGVNGGAWVAAWFGCLARGAVVVPLDQPSAPDFIERIQQQVNAKLIVCDEPIALDTPALSLKDLRNAVNHHSPERLVDEMIQPDDLAQIIFTSGTTAEPKGVCLSHRNLLANLAPLEQGIDEYRKWERPFHPIRFLCLLPLSHVFGQFMGIFVPQLLGGEVHFLDSLNPAEIIATVKRERISVIAAVPRQLETLRDKIERDYATAGKLDQFKHRFAAADGHRFIARMWRFRDVHRRFGWKCWAFVAGGATLPPETEQFWMRLGFAVVQGYGMTETASLVSVNHPFKLSKGSIGKTLPGQELKLDADGTILVRGENVATGYWQAGATRSLTTDDGWLLTGDVGALDAQGNLFFKGRAKDIIVTAAGLNLFPADLEAALNQQPAIKDSCVVGIETASGPEAVAVLIARDTTDDTADLADSVQRANASLSQAQQLRRWLLWLEADFPRTATQKVRKPLVKHWAEQQLSGPATANSSETVSPLLQLLAQVSGRSVTELQALPPSAELSAGLGLDSLGRVSLASALEDRFQLALDDAAITPQTTLHELERLVAFDVPTVKAQSAGAAAPTRVYPYPYPYPAWAMHWLTWLVRMFWYYVLILPVTCLLCWTRKRGVENLRELHEPALFICNHISRSDHGPILAALPWRYRHRLAIAMEGERLRSWRYPDAALRWWTRWRLRMQYVMVVTCFNVFPLPQQSGFRRSFEYAATAIERGYSLLVFPEGRYTPDGALQPFMAGIGLLAKELKVPVVPIRIDGLYEIKARQRHWAWPGSVTLTFGQPLSVQKQQTSINLPQQLHEIVASL